MFRRSTLAIAGLTLGAGLVITGCQSSSAHPVAAATSPSTQAVYCDECKVTWVRIPDGRSRGHVWGYHQVKRMECPDCKDAVSNFFTTGKLEHHCSACGGNMSICEAH